MCSSPTRSVPTSRRCSSLRPGGRGDGLTWAVRISASRGRNFSTRAESKIYRSWGVDVIGMTNISEARLAREAEICYGTIALATDYDCWHEEHDDVSVEAVIAIIQQNVATARKIIKTAVGQLAGERACPCADALKYAIMTHKELIPASTRQKLDVIMGKYLG
jgi:5'-methylthioadenosine phosphorylase